MGASAAQASAIAVRKALRELTANLLRVMRGSGQPDRIAAQAAALAADFAAYRDVCGEDPCAEDVADALSFEIVLPEDFDEGLSGWDRAMREMISGALQVAAAELLAQQAQAAAGRRELFAGYRQIEKIHTRQLRRLLRRLPGEGGSEPRSGSGG